MHMSKLSLFLILVIGLTACWNKKKTDPFKGLSQEEVQQKLDDMNKAAVNSEKDLIDAYVKRKQWTMTETGTGLRYIVYQNGAGSEFTKVGDLATIKYEVSLLDGTICYTSEEEGPKEFLVEADDVESGLHEGIKYMKVGDRAKMIIPSHLAHGLLGDWDKIPPRSTIVYDVELLRIR